MSERNPAGTATPPPTVGEGCVRRYDPEALNEELGTEFAEAAELWRLLQQKQRPDEETPAAD